MRLKDLHPPLYSTHTRARVSLLFLISQETSLFVYLYKGAFVLRLDVCTSKYKNIVLHVW